MRGLLWTSGSLSARTTIQQPVAEVCKHSSQVPFPTAHTWTVKKGARALEVSGKRKT